MDTKRQGTPKIQGWRFIKPDGSLNIDSSSYRAAALSDLYHFLLSTSWFRLLKRVLYAYLVINLFFGSAYFLAGPHALEGIQGTTPFERFLDCFFFSVQTLATIGYGRISPVSIIAHLIVTVEALVGLLGLAVTTGIVFSRFSRPTARIIFSRNALVTPVGGAPSLIFRMANARLNQIVEARVRVVFARDEVTPEGEEYRELYDLKLERDQTPLFSMSWTIVHEIDAKSPLFGQTFESLASSDAGIIITVNGTDETFSQNVHSRFSYTAEDIVWNAQFEDVISKAEDGKIHVALEKIHDLKCDVPPSRVQAPIL